jgi:antitoxin component YwqK of YwqJK toxin-antitoxin module
MFLYGGENGLLDGDNDDVITNLDIKDFYESSADEVAGALNQKVSVLTSEEEFPVFNLSEPVPGSLSVKINTCPENCAVFLDAFFVGYSPLEIALSSENKLFKFYKPGYELNEREIDLSELNKTGEMNVALKKDAFYEAEYSDSEIYILYSEGIIDKSIELRKEDNTLKIVDYKNTDEYRITILNKEGLKPIKQYFKKNNKLHGYNTSWYPNGKIKFQEKYVDGKKLGEQFYFYKDGKNRLIEYDGNNNVHGRDELYDEKGKVLEQSIFKNGVKQNYINRDFLKMEHGLLKYKDKNNVEFSGFSISNHENGNKKIINEYENGKPTGNKIIFEIAKEADSDDLKNLEEIIYYKLNLPVEENPFYVTLFLTAISYKIQYL